MTGPFVEIAAGHKLFVRDWGEGPTVVLLAGWALDSRVWSKTMLALNAAGMRTVAYDRRGHGRSTDPGRIDYDLLADDLAAVLESLDLANVTLVAHSGAGGEAIRYLTRHGARRIARLVLVGATGPQPLADDVPPAVVDQVLTQIATNLSGWVDLNAEPFAPGASARTIEWLGTMVLDASRKLVADFQRVIAASDFGTEAAALDVPVVIVHGDRDASAPIDVTARRYAAIIPNAELIVYQHVAHGVMITHAKQLASDIAGRAALA